MRAEGLLVENISFVNSVIDSQNRPENRLPLPQRPFDIVYPAVLRQPGTMLIEEEYVWVV